MADEKTSARVAQIASKALQNPRSVTPDEIQTLAASALTQSQDTQQRQQAQQFLQKQQGPQQGQPGQQGQQNQQNQQKK